MSEINENPEINEVAEVAAEVPAKPFVKVLKETSAKADEDFDWEEFEGTKSVNSTASKKEMTDLYDNTLSILQEKEVVDGKVIAMNKREVVVDIGYKSDGIVSVNEFRYNPALKVGDKVEVYVETLEDKKGQLTLSHKKARAMRSWDRVNAALENDEIITGFIKCRTKGGMIVDVFGIEAFLPGSQIDVKPIRDYDIYVNKTMEFKVVKINHEFRNVVVSHKALIEAELEQQKKDIISKLEKGQVLEGTVKNITSYGVFIDLGGVDGLIHITDLSWGRVAHPNEIVQLDQKINVVILDFDDDKNNRRLSLGHKQLEENPWDVFETIFTVDSVHEGTVIDLFDKGAVISLPYGVEGFATPRHLVKEDGSNVKMDEKLEFKVIEFSKSAKRIILSHSRVYEDVKKSEETAKKKATAKTTSKGMKTLKDNVEKTTLGDISELAALRTQMEEKEKRDN